mgnify:CR=1 FL=1
MFIEIFVVRHLTLYQILSLNLENALVINPANNIDRMGNQPVRGRVCAKRMPHQSWYAATSPHVSLLDM